MKKKVDATAIVNELQGSVFFPEKNGKPAPEQAGEALETKETPSKSELPTQSSDLSSKQDSKLASMLSLPSVLVESIRKIVKALGKEVLYVRLTQEEKEKLGDVSYTYKRQGIKTSDNEIVRIAINTVLEDFKTNGEASMLARVIAALHA